MGLWWGRAGAQSGGGGGAAPPSGTPGPQVYKRPLTLGGWQWSVATPTCLGRVSDDWGPQASLLPGNSHVAQMSAHSRPCARGSVADLVAVKPVRG